MNDSKYFASVQATREVTRGDEHKEELQSYYKLTEKDMEEITKEWHT
jgi:hypothetical protein